MKIKVICKGCQKPFSTTANQYGYPNQYYCQGYCRNHAPYGVIPYGCL